MSIYIYYVVIYKWKRSIPHIYMYTYDVSRAHLQEEALSHQRGPLGVDVALPLPKHEGQHESDRIERVDGGCALPHIPTEIRKLTRNHQETIKHLVNIIENLLEKPPNTPKQHDKARHSVIVSSFKFFR